MISAKELKEIEPGFDDEDFKQEEIEQQLIVLDGELRSARKNNESCFWFENNSTNPDDPLYIDINTKMKNGITILEYIRSLGYMVSCPINNTKYGTYKIYW